MKVHELPNGRIHEGRAEDFYLDAEPGYSLVISDGAYGMNKAAWDRVKIDHLADWYRPHMEAWTRLCAPSASVYLWNTAEGWARLDPVMRGLGWAFRSLIVWDKGPAPAALGWGAITTWADETEVCGHYQRGTPHHEAPSCAEAGNIWRFHFSKLGRERIKTGELRPAKCASDGMVSAALHPTQKPLLFAERMIRASSRPGDRILVPFGGTCREAVVCEWLARTNPAEARSYDACELNEDPGRDYIGPVLDQINGRPRLSTDTGQVGLFGPVDSARGAGYSGSNG